jgi:thiazole synthase
MHRCQRRTNVTVAIRRIPTDEKPGEMLIDHLKGLTLLPNTALCYNAKDAILTAQLAREALETDLVKLEVIGDEKTLFPDNEGLLEAARVLVKDGFTVCPTASTTRLSAANLKTPVAPP